MRLLRRKCTFLLDIIGLTLLFILGCLVVYQFWSEPAPLSNSFLSLDDVTLNLQLQLPQGEREPRSLAPEIEMEKSSAPPQYRHCTMTSCFDISRCMRNGFRVYVYPDTPGREVSGLYSKILREIRSSRYFTSDPEKACLFVPSIDTLDRDKLSMDFTNNLPELDNLQFWNNGENHLIFNQYSGSWPEYDEMLDFDTDKAILAKASFSVDHFRPEFDISLPLMHKDHPQKAGQVGMLSSKGNLFPVKRKYVLAFKGKRYLYGVGSQTRSSLYHIHNGKDLIMLTTCKHNTDWKRYKDERCERDNELYDRYDYSDLLTNSSFCLVPRGRRLGSFRFLESLQASCIPVSMSNGYILPFGEVIEWEKASLTMDERQLLQVPHVVRGVPPQQLLSMRLHTQFLWETYFSSVGKIVTATLEIIRNRIQFRSQFVWNHAPGGLALYPDFSPHLLDYPFYNPQRVTRLNATNFTVVITCMRPALKGSSPLVRLVKSIAPAPHLDKIIILWGGTGPPRISLPPFSVPVIIQVRNLSSRLTQQFWPLPGVVTDAVLHLDENTELTVDEAEFGFATWKAFPDRLVGFVAHKHYWNPVDLQWSYSSQWTNDYSMVLSGAVFYHRYYGYILSELLPPAVRNLADKSRHCLDIAMNFLVSHITHRPPVKVTHRKELTKTQDSPAVLQKLSSDRVACLNMIVTAYGSVPLRSSYVRMDPVLFKDNVSMLRKEYRKLETF